MREIKFRAWHRTERQMINVYVLDQTSKAGGPLNTNLSKGYNDSYPPQKTFYLHDVELMQYTGLKDKNGKEIYEGDIVVLWLLKNDVRSKYFTGKVVNHGYAGFTIDTSNDYMEFEIKQYEYEVIGNIYENPELLKL